ncbi:MAG: serpin family protein, partial [Myxococcota bacterium]
LVELPYADNFAATFILFDAPSTTWGTKLNRNSIEDWLDQLARQKVTLRMPRFELKPGAAIDLKAALSALGMSEAFSRRANFSKMTEGKTDDLYLDAVFHKAYVAMDEKGTEAAAATAAMVATKGFDPSEPKKVTLDKPFLFLIRDQKTDAIMFVGKVENPKG